MTNQTGARERGDDLLHSLAGLFPAEAGVVEGRMFNGSGLKVDGRFFAFISSLGKLGLKLPHDAVQDLVASGGADPMTMGRRTMREWVSVAQPASGDAKEWLAMAERARSFVRDKG